MAKAAGAGKELDSELMEHQKQVDNAWSPKGLTALGIVTLFVAIALIVFMATRMTTCMYLDGSQP